MSIIDWIALSIGVFFILRGLISGCSGELGRLAGILGAGVLWYLGYLPLLQTTGSVKILQGHPYATRIITILIILSGSLAVWIFIRRILSETIRLALSQPFDALLGGIIGAVKALALIFILCTFETMMPEKNNPKKGAGYSLTTKKLYPLFKQLDLTE